MSFNTSSHEERKESRETSARSSKRLYPLILLMNVRFREGKALGSEEDML
jgi:hypothetical protein